MIAGFQKLNAFSLLPFVAETLHLFSPEVLAGVFPACDEPFLGFPSSEIFCFWDKNKLNLMESVFLVLNIPDDCSNDRFISIRTLTFLYDNFRISHNSYFVDSQTNP
ncbi:hypothetical protein ES288_D04G119000v1 [Gossypium darwinii]|uniref:Uncharacterized protein n=1 Tax=Gossypium darwinii TaxID=34276 RepID=A0A5D2CZE8_GOSDA|nr:hypothetical protein ES288_D04G119000v1 [Gossypium darwinii]